MVNIAGIACLHATRISFDYSCRLAKRHRRCERNAFNLYNLNDTITAISTASVTQGTIAKSIVRISGPEAFTLLNEVFAIKVNSRKITNHSVELTEGVNVDFAIYTFTSPNSYTAENLAELHFFAAGCVVELVLEKLLQKARLAGPGEFTLRAYLNGKVDLTQAEAVSQIVSSSNRTQLAAAEKLLSGKLSEKIAVIRDRILDTLSLIEAGLDFSEEDIEFVSRKQALQTVTEIKAGLEEILNGSIHYEEMIDLPSAGLAGASNAGKSSLINTLLGTRRSIVSETEATTRDILTGILELDKNWLAIFDCAGLYRHSDKLSLLDKLAQDAAIEALKSCDMVLFCVDITKEDLAEDVSIKKHIKNKQIIYVATKCDLADDVEAKLRKLNTAFDAKFIATSSTSNDGTEPLRTVIDTRITKLREMSSEIDEFVTINQRHKATVQNAIANLKDAHTEIDQDNEEVVSMLLRAAHESLGGLEREDVDEQVLDRIFSTFCIGK